MTDPELLSKKLALIETCVRELRDLAHLAELEDSVRERRFVEHTLQIGIQAAIDVGSHIVSDQRYGEPASNRALFDLLKQNGWLPAELAAALGDMAGFRNVLVHGYADVNLDIVRDVVTNHLDDLLNFASTVRRRLRE